MLSFSYWLCILMSHLLVYVLEILFSTLRFLFPLSLTTSLKNRVLVWSFKNINNILTLLCLKFINGFPLHSEQNANSSYGFKRSTDLILKLLLIMFTYFCVYVVYWVWYKPSLTLPVTFIIIFIIFTSFFIFPLTAIDSGGVAQVSSAFTNEPVPSSGEAEHPSIHVEEVTTDQQSI